MNNLLEIFVVSNIPPFSAFMLSTQLNYLIEENTLSLYCICVLKRHVTNILKDGRYGGFLGEIWVIYLFFYIMPTDNHSLWHFMTGGW